MNVTHRLVSTNNQSIRSIGYCDVDKGFLTTKKFHYRRMQQTGRIDPHNTIDALSYNDHEIKKAASIRSIVQKNAKRYQLESKSNQAIRMGHSEIEGDKIYQHASKQSKRMELKKADSERFGDNTCTTCSTIMTDAHSSREQIQNDHPSNQTTANEHSSLVRQMQNKHSINQGKMERDCDHVPEAFVIDDNNDDTISHLDDDTTFELDVSRRTQQTERPTIQNQDYIPRTIILHRTSSFQSDSDVSNLCFGCVEEYYSKEAANFCQQRVSL